MISAQQQAAYQQNGYLVLPHFKSSNELLSLRQRAQAIVQAFDPAERSGIFTTNEQVRQTDDYFMGSANTVRCFFEEEAFGADGQLKVADFGLAKPEGEDRGLTRTGTAVGTPDFTAVHTAMATKLAAPAVAIIA